MVIVVVGRRGCEEKLVSLASEPVSCIQWRSAPSEEATTKDTKSTKKNKNDAFFLLLTT